ncbi:hypothetical protein ACJIZ3_007242 [Penstemon smallii]|uniref:Uncharacterized protein n=1 Tax=Penstemon smallii TaxID=265156 RepID=A0ABD3SA50_9LAMI
MKKKIVIKVSMNNNKSRAKALKIAVGVPGVESVGLIGEGKNQMQVVGEGIDSVQLTRLLRKKFEYAELISVGEDKKVQDSAARPHSPAVGWDPPPCSHYVEIRDRTYDPSCTIM